MMSRGFLSLVLLIMASVPLRLSAFAAPQSELPTASQYSELVASALPTVVQFSYDGFGNGQLHFGCGVIVSPEGHVVVSGPVAAVLDNRLLELRLPDGRKVPGEALGWSSEFGFGVLKITQPGKWPFVKLSDQVRAGEVCLALGYNRQHDGDKDFGNSRPENRLAVVTRVSEGEWFTSSHQSEFSAHPVFNLNGELLGLSTSSPVGGDAIHNSARVVKDHWNELAAGGNLDRKRLLDETKPPVDFGRLPEKMSGEALAKVKAASVQIGDVGKKPTFSGVVVRDGFVITCAHHNRLPNAILMVTLPDGRSAKVVVAGTNWVTDACILKITDEGVWPSVDLGYSSALAEGEPLVLIGYPITNKQQHLVLESRLIAPTQGLNLRDFWSDSLYTACNEEEVARNLRGASGGGIFDNAGNLIGILSSTVGNELSCVRVELFRKNWPALAASKKVGEIDSKMRESAVTGLKQLMSELANSDPKN